MILTTTAFTGDVPEHYHRELGPLLFEPYATDVAHRVARLAPQPVLETACGTGIVTAHLARELGTSTAIVATDLNEAMIATARRAVAGDIEFLAADMAALPFPDRTFDLVVCQFGLMFVPDPGLAVREARRVLARGGTWLVSTWSSLSRNSPPRIAHETIAAMFPASPPKFYETPFSHADPAALRELISAGGFSSVGVERVCLHGRARSARVAATGLVLGNPAGEEIRQRDPARVDEAIAAVEQAFVAQYGTGAFEVELEALVATAVA